MPQNTSPADLAAVIHAHDQRRRRHPLLFACSLLLTAVALILLFGHLARVRQPGTVFVTTDLQRGDIRLLVTATGTLEPTNKVTVGSELSGTALEVLVSSNDRVRKDQVLARLDARKLTQQTDSSRAALAAARAKVLQARATVTESEATLARARNLQQLSAGQLPAGADMDAAVAAVARARANLAGAEAEVAAAAAQLQANETDLAKTVIRSPIDGIVLTRSLEPGQTVAASFTAPELFVIAEQLEQMKLKVSVAEADIARVVAGQDASFTVDAWPERTYSALVTKVAYSSTITDNVVTYQAELQLANTELSLRPGMTATVDIRVAEAKDVLLAPLAALRFDPAAGTPPTTTTTTEKKSFLQSLVPGPPPSEKKHRDTADTATATAADSRLWLLRDGHPAAVSVSVGLNNGRLVEVAGNDLREGLSVIVRSTGGTTP
ncbi:MAG: efflux transporter periplasmic adaptor subunit [Desulfobulbaceae bacterium A2]|nr:MAG: efflux transporter periplasmic adaptor subunit [Desulfobulbaceae bacterium A2]